MSKLSKLNVSSPKLWAVVGVGVAGIVILAEVRRRRLGARNSAGKDCGAFIERFELVPFPQPSPPAARLILTGLTFAINDNIHVKGYVTGFGSPEWKRTHEAAAETAVAVSALLKSGATCVGKTIMDELGLGVTGKNVHYGTPTNHKFPLYIPGGSSSGSAVAVASNIVDFALATDTTGCIRVPSSFCGILGFRSSHGVVPTVGILAISQSLDAIGWFARDPSVLCKIGRILLQSSSTPPKRTRRIIIADDLFQLSKVPKLKTVHVVRRVTEKLSGFQASTDINFGKYIASNVPSLKAFQEKPVNTNHGNSISRALSSVMCLLLSYEFRSNYEEWMCEVKLKLDSDVSDRITAAISLTPEEIKLLYKVRKEMRAAVNSLLKDDGILVIPTTADPPSKLPLKTGLSKEARDRAFSLLSIASISGCCEAAVPFGEHDNLPVSVSFIASHGNDNFMLHTLMDMHSSLDEEVTTASNASILPETIHSLDESELLKEKGNAAYKGRLWNKAVSYYTEAIKLNETNATYYSNRAAAYLELGCFRQAEEDCDKAISLDMKNVKAYLRRGTAKESLLLYKEALQDFRHAHVLEPQNKIAKLAEKRLRKLMSY